MSRRKRDTTFSFPGFEVCGGFTRVPDTLFDTLLPHLGEAELKALLYIVRRTAGFEKEDDAIALSQFLDGIVTRTGKVLDGGCGVRDRTTLITALRSLETMGVIESEKGRGGRGTNATTVYRLRRRYSMPKPAPDSPPADPTDRAAESHPPSALPASYPHAEVPGDSLSGREFPAEVIGNSHVQDTQIQERGILNSNLRMQISFFCILSRKSGDPGREMTQLVTFGGLPRLGRVGNDPEPSKTSPQPPPPPPAAARPPSVIPTLSTKTPPAIHGVSPQAPPGTRVIPEKWAFIHQQPTNAGFGDGLGGDKGWDAAAPEEAPDLPPLADSGFSPPPLPFAPPACDYPAQPPPPPSPPLRGDAELWADDHRVREQCYRYMQDFTRDFNDAASLRSSVSRLVNLYYRAGVPMDVFVEHLRRARAITQERTSSIRTRAANGDKSKASYFFAVLQNRLESREPPIPPPAPDPGPEAEPPPPSWWTPPPSDVRARPPYRDRY